MITVGALVASGIAPTQARQFFQPLLKTATLFEINTPPRQAAFVAQCAHESSWFVHLEESLYYRDPARIMAIFPSAVRSLAFAQTLVGNPRALANTVYAMRNGNGDAASGDGWKFRGRGLIQLTGRSNYTAASLALATPYVDTPELVALALDACLTAGWFWQRARCNDLADHNQFDSITRAINGAAMAGAADRRSIYQNAFAAFSEPLSPTFPH